ncbi:MAG: endolytic transglycosylase MltG [Gammaproteobacteria bacterium]|nr:endolytic transglycosylase MltG [Gammaproteobacteria bacterium]
MLKQVWFWVLMASILVIALFTYGAIRQVQVWLYEPIPVTEPTLVTIAVGSNLGSVSHSLYKAGVIAHAQSFKYYAKWRQLDRHIKAGEYQFKGSINSVEVLAQLVSGKVLEYQLTVPEGLTYNDFVALLSQHPAMQGKPVPKAKQWLRQLHSRQDHPEGLLFPSTYRFARHNLPLDIIEQAHLKQLQVLQSEWATRAENLPYKTPYEALILASIIEKETGLPTERGTIAGVFVRRLQKGMKLQTDPSVIYGMGTGFNGNIRRSDLMADTPYNTYVHKGLPPTPIALPGRAAIHAALHPEQGFSLFFVAKGDGSHVFADTYSQHQANVRQYQLNN